jgi:hypothetical protein
VFSEEQHMTTAEDLLEFVNNVLPVEDPGDEVERELIMSCRDRRVGGEDTLLANGLYIVVANRLSSCFLYFLVQEFDGEEARMTFVHMETAQPVVAERSKHPYSADAQYHLLTQSIVFIAAIQHMGEGSISLTVLG